jgi:putative DNA-invertase from lambdoid prophage Rac
MTSRTPSATLCEGVVIRTIINDIDFDGSKTYAMGMALRDAMMTFMAGMAQARMEATRDAQRAGINYAKANGPEKSLGRKPTFGAHQLAEVLRMADLGESNSEIAPQIGLVSRTVIRIRADPTKAEKMVALWAGI